jgi:putative transposase
MKVKGKPSNKKSLPGQMSLPWNQWEASDPEIQAIAQKFVLANCYELVVPGIKTPKSL